MGNDGPASSVRSEASSCDASRFHESDLARPQMGVPHDTERLRVDVLSIGANFEGEAVAPAYPGEIDLRG
jgi:hypothetical protein